MATIGHENGPAHAPFRWAWLEATVTVVVLKAPPSVAVCVAVWMDETVPAVALNVVEDELVGTVTEPGTGSAVVLLDDKVTVVPPVGAV
jgi:hypothetical protein